MPGLLWLLMYAALFYLMMRYGCGAHMVHGGHGGRDHQGAAEGPPSKDPVCGMEVGPTSGYTVMHQGRAYRFCSRQCLDKFEAQPASYAEKGA